MMQIIFDLLKNITEFKEKILKLSHLFFLQIYRNVSTIFKLLKKNTKKSR
jgi:hypothetical protein